MRYRALFLSLAVVALMLIVIVTGRPKETAWLFFLVAMAVSITFMVMRQRA